MRAEKLDDIVKKVAPQWTLKALLATRLGKGLTGESCAQNVVLRDRRDIERSYVAVWPEPKVLFIKVCQMFVDLAGKDTLVTESSQCLMKAPQARKQVNESISLQLPALRHLPSNFS